jgi:isovaleryl-CoA dehydrogenase
MYLNTSAAKDHPMYPLLSETALIIRDSVSQFAQKEIAPLAHEIDLTNVFPENLWQKLGRMGLLGITVESEYGGAGLGYLEHVISMEEISRASGSIGLSYGAHSNLCVNQIRRNGTPAQKEKYLPKLVSGEHVGALAMSETGSGSDVMSLTLSATLKDDKYILNGSKMWITNGPDAHTVVVYARTDKGAGSKGITAFIIERDLPGFFVHQKLDKLGMRGSNTCELVFENTPVAQENILGRLNEGAKVLMSGLNYERLILAAGPIGILQACLDTVVPYIHERKQFGKAIGEFQFIQGKVADMYTALCASRALVYSLAQKADKEKELKNKDAAAAILFTSETATQMALEAIQCLGGNGYINEFPTGRYLRDAKLYEIGAGTSEIRRLVIGREIFEESM